MSGRHLTNDIITSIGRLLVSAGKGTEVKQSDSIAQIVVTMHNHYLTFKQRRGPNEQNKQSVRSEFTLQQLGAVYEYV